MKFTFKSEIIPLLLVVISIALGFYFYSVFPEQVPVHWNAAGQIDRYGSRLEGAIIGPAVLLGMYLLFLFIPLIDPKKEKYESFAKTYFAFRLVLLAAMFAIFSIASLNGAGHNIKVEIWIPLLIGLLFMFLGNYMGKIKPNWFMGIRTPWTLENPEVWAKTHRLGGKMFMLMGLIMMLTPLFPAQSVIWLIMAPIVIVALVPIIYSYVIFKKIKKTNQQ